MFEDFPAEISRAGLLRGDIRIEVGFIEPFSVWKVGRRQRRETGGPFLFWHLLILSFVASPVWRAVAGEAGFFLKCLYFWEPGCSTTQVLTLWVSRFRIFEQGGRER